MDWMRQLKTLAGEAAQRASDGAEQLTRAVAERAPGFVGDSAAELLAERQYRRAHKLAASGLDDATAREVANLLDEVSEVDCDYAVGIHRLLGQALERLGQPAAAREHFEQAVALLQEAPSRLAAERAMVDLEDGTLADEWEAELHIRLANLALNEGAHEAALRHSRLAIDCDAKAYTGYYLQGRAAHAKGLPARVTAESFMRAVTNGADPEMVLGWVDELIPTEREWFARFQEG